jgi:ABC-type dipeptide/oligopeptide/nickel transport system ATPase subunit
MEIEIRYCNNIDLAKIALSDNKLNIKFAPNGTGKSTVAKAIMYSTAEDANLLNELMPFKLRGSNPDNKKPEIIGTENIKKLMCFNEDYVNQFVFKKDELLSNSFDIFIRTGSYKEKEIEIEDLVTEIKKLFNNNPELENLIATLKEMSGSFKLTSSGLSKSSTGMKGLSGGNKIQHIPAGLEAFQPFIQSQNSVGWIDWQTQGYEFFDLVDTCPFCTSDAADRKEQIKKVGQEYDKNTIKNLIAIIKVIEKLGDYFSEDARSKLMTITALKEGLEKEHVTFIVNVKKQIDTLVEKLEKLRTLSGFHFKNGDNVSEQLPSYKLDLQFFSELNAQKTQEAITPINTSIEAVIKKAGVLQGKINAQRRDMQEIIQKHQSAINGFLSYAGYRYRVEIAGEDEQAQLKLLHIDHNAHLSGGNQHLSFGERNAFALVLFMYECLAKNPDLIILDDPISSFDKNKKYAILEMLFRRDSGSCLKNKTVLMLTHDVEPIIDTVKSLAQKFYNLTSASFLKLSSGQIEEKAIAKNDIQTFSQICKNALGSDKDDIIKLIYLRRYYEISDDKGDAYQVLSNLFHKRERAIDSREPKDQDEKYPEMVGGKFAAGCTEIQGKITGFVYHDILQRLADKNILKSLYATSQNGYEKLQIFRFFDLNIQNSVIQKFINETYHIENEFICQLDPAKFDTIPEYIIEECNKVLQEAQ